MRCVHATYGLSHATKGEHWLRRMDQVLHPVRLSLLLGMTKCGRWTFWTFWTFPSKDTERISCLTRIFVSIFVRLKPCTTALTHTQLAWQKKQKLWLPKMCEQAWLSQAQPCSTAVVVIIVSQHQLTYSPASCLLRASCCCSKTTRALIETQRSCRRHSAVSQFRTPFTQGTMSTFPYAKLRKWLAWTVVVLPVILASGLRQAALTYIEAIVSVLTAGGV